ncbi:CLUMA_CG019645, isoform A [Clunio marinus]|uniref:CLUMA_CG019645, isoform A n=1 Tax=Clunio marinus TaxID=568069 RepID=A0A1J1J5W9_9DIPT|nr:CLUMA_CG019645, isoform A [Clunio marinus]
MMRMYFRLANQGRMSVIRNVKSRCLHV